MRKTKIMLVAFCVMTIMMSVLAIPAQAAEKSVADAIVKTAESELAGKTVKVKVKVKVKGKTVTKVTTKKVYNKGSFYVSQNKGNGSAWCSEFASYCLKEALEETKSNIKWKPITSAKQWKHKDKYAKYTCKTSNAYKYVKPGDILSSGHTMVVVKKTSSGVEVIEGNPGGQQKQGKVLKKNSAGLLRVRYPKSVINRYPYVTRFK